MKKIILTKNQLLEISQAINVNGPSEVPSVVQNAFSANKTGKNMDVTVKVGTGTTNGNLMASSEELNKVPDDCTVTVKNPNNQENQVSEMIVVNKKKLEEARLNNIRKNGIVTTKGELNKKYFK